MFPSLPPEKRMVEPVMEAAGIEPAQDSPGLLYAVRAVNGGPIKIGWTSSSESLPGRLASLQTGNPFRLEVIWTSPGAPRDERNLHRELRRWRLCGEWFEAAPEVARRFGALQETSSHGHVYDEAFEAGWHRGWDDCNWDETDRPKKSLRVAENFDEAHRAFTLTGSAWARKQMCQPWRAA